MPDLPLDEPVDTPIAELFARNPGDLSANQIDLIIAKLRSQRSRFLTGDKTAGSPKPPSKTKKAELAATKVTGALDLGDLGL